MTEKERQKATEHIIKYGGEGYDDPMDNYPLTPEIRAKREQRRREAEERGYPMTREEVRAAVLADMEASELYFGRGVGETIYVRGQAYSVIYELDATTGSYAVWFPYIEGCYTCGDTLAHARAMARERLEIYLDDQGKN